MAEPRHAADREQAQLAATGAATLAAGRLSEEVGLERGAERLLGLNRFSIDPSLRAGRRHQPDRAPHRRQAHHPRPERALLPGPARATSDRLISLSSTRSPTGFSLLLTREDRPGGFGFDLRLRQSR